MSSSSPLIDLRHPEQSEGGEYTERKKMVKTSL
jgi:hypothetical protein